MHIFAERVVVQLLNVAYYIEVHVRLHFRMAADTFNVFVSNRVGFATFSVEQGDEQLVVAGKSVHLFETVAGRSL